MPEGCRGDRKAPAASAETHLCTEYIAACIVHAKLDREEEVE